MEISSVTVMDRRLIRRQRKCLMIGKSSVENDREDLTIGIEPEDIVRVMKAVRRYLYRCKG